MDWNDDFAGNIQFAIQQQVIAGMNEPSQTVFDGRQKAVCGSIVNRREERLEGCSRHKRDVFTKEFDRSLFTKCASGALKSDAQCFLALHGKSRRSWFMTRLGGEILNAAGFVNDGPIEFYDCPIVQGAIIRFAHTLDHFALPRMIAKRRARFLLRFADLQGEASAFVEQTQEIAVKLVNPRTPIIDAHLNFPLFAEHSLPNSTQVPVIIRDGAAAAGEMTYKNPTAYVATKIIWLRIPRVIVTPQKFR